MHRSTSTHTKRTQINANTARKDRERQTVSVVRCALCVRLFFPCVVCVCFLQLPFLIHSLNLCCPANEKHNHHSGPGVALSQHHLLRDQPIRLDVRGWGQRGGGDTGPPGPPGPQLRTAPMQTMRGLSDYLRLPGPKRITRCDCVVF